MLRQCALQLLLAGGASLATASPRYDSGLFDGTWDDRIMGPSRSPNEEGDPPKCRAGLCAGAGVRYPTGPGIVFESLYNIPELPASFGPDTTLTDYLYFNIVFDSAEAQAKGGHFNQFVPQLMLGGCLTNSSGPPDYHPIFTRLDKWAIGAQYFFALANQSSPSNWTGHAATGKLIHVEPGDVVFTKFELGTDHVWTLSMGLKDSKPETHSVVKATAPFMGLDANMPTWDSPLFNTTRAGCCWEVYNVKNRGDFPPDGMNITVEVTAADTEVFPDWQIQEKPTCPYSPEYSLSSKSTSTTQQVDLDIFFSPDHGQ